MNSHCDTPTFGHSSPSLPAARRRSSVVSTSHGARSPNRARTAAVSAMRVAAVSSSSATAASATAPDSDRR
ncbi:Uncharacterised protein [Mycobacterium tuberculosis]|uniref:Uncharacterized protein n=1 Tax=Mycobacterium tuberculosis TaxID=1773 RepID=A0A0U0R7C8_MYCTX|nr:Uncharacterised protein [Mycobacterium tuberculosis]